MVLRSHIAGGGAFFLCLALTAAPTHGEVVTPTVCQDLWPEISSILAGDSLCYATIDNVNPVDATSFLVPTCMSDDEHAYQCHPCDSTYTLNCSIGGQRRAYELPAGWEIASALSPEDIARSSKTAIAVLATVHPLSTTEVKLRDSLVFTVGATLAGNPGAAAVVGTITPCEDCYHWVSSQEGANRGGFDGWVGGPISKTVDREKLLIRTCPRGMFMPAPNPVTIDQGIAPPSKCAICNATFGCALQGPGSRCHTTIALPSSLAQWWDGAGSTACDEFRFKEHSYDENACLELYNAKRGVAGLISASYSSVDGNCYRALDDDITAYPESSVVSQQPTAISAIPAGFEIVDLHPRRDDNDGFQGSVNFTRRAVQQMVWLHSFGTKSLVMKGAVVYTRHAFSGFFPAGRFESSDTLCAVSGCKDLVLFEEQVSPPGWCPSMWCKSEVGGVYARILIKTCDAGFYNDGENTGNLGWEEGACRLCNGTGFQTTVLGQPWNGIGATGCVMPAPTNAPTVAPTTTAPTSPEATKAPTAAPTTSPSLSAPPTPAGAAPSPSNAAGSTPPPSLSIALLAGLLVCFAAIILVGGTIALTVWIRARRHEQRLLRIPGLHSRESSRFELTPRVSAMSEISRALLEPLATDESSASSIESLASDDARAKRIIDQGLWIEPATIVVGRRLASGGMGELRLGRMTLPAAGAGSAGRRGKTKVTVVLKSSFIEMLGGDSDEFWHEASMLSQIKHPQVVRLFGVTQKEVRGMLNAETKKRLFLVMEYCPNGSLTDAVRKPGGYDRKRDFLRHAKQITSTLAWLHAQGIVHRDIKPSNVLLDDEGSAKLCDLGLSRFQPGIGPGATPSVGFTSATMTVGAGSAPYMPPEGLAADSQDRQRQYDGRAWDVYSLSMLLSQMWTRKQLYEGLGVFQIVVRVSQGMRPELATDSREVPPRLREIVSSMWDADRHARPSAEEVLTMLRDPALAAQIEACEG